MILISPFLWLNFFFFVILAISPFAFSLPIVPLPAPPPPPPAAAAAAAAENSKSAPFKPSIAVVIGVLTTLFSITFLVLLYAKHCKRGTGNGVGSSAYPPDLMRKNSGIDRTVIESLPVFRFGSLTGLKDGLECAVCLNTFDPNHVLRLLPKCNHAFHVECVDTWLDAHSTCPLCRFRVDPEDVLLVMDPPAPTPPDPDPDPIKPTESRSFRASGRHSWAGGERGARNPLQVSGAPSTASFNGRRSFDSWKKKSNNGKSSGSGKNNSNETTSVGGTDKANRKDGLLLADKTDQQRRPRLEHRIIVSDTSGPHYRWSDVEPSDSLYLQSALLFTESRRFWDSRRSTTGAQSGRAVINGRSVSEITGLSRFRSNEIRQRQEGAVTRWLAWIAHSPSQCRPHVQSDTTTTTAV